MEDEGRIWPQLIGVALGLAVLVLAVFASFAGLRMAAFVSMLLALLTGGQVLLAYSWPGLSGNVTVYQKNVLFRNAELPALAEDIRASKPDVVTLQEVLPENEAWLDGMRDAFPTRHLCPGGVVGGTAVLSRLPAVAGTAFCGPGLAAVQLVGGTTENPKPFWAVSVHLHWPWPYQQADHVALLLPILDRLQGPAVMAGDFNMVRWGISVRELSEILGVRAAGPTAGSYVGLSRILPLPIDHVFATGGGRVGLRPTLGSDHLGLLALVSI